MENDLKSFSAKFLHSSRVGWVNLHWNLGKISLQYVLEGLVDDKSSLVQMILCHWSWLGNRPLIWNNDVPWCIHAASRLQCVHQWCCVDFTDFTPKIPDSSFPVVDEVPVQSYWLYRSRVWNALNPINTVFSRKHLPIGPGRCVSYFKSISWKYNYQTNYTG